MQTIGEKIKKLRKQKGVSQEETAFELGVTRQTVSKWESGAMQPNAESIRMLSDYFAVSPDYFFGVQTAAETETSQTVTEPAPAFALAPALAKGKTKAFIACLVLLIVSTIAITVFVACTVGYGITAWSSMDGYSVVTTYAQIEHRIIFFSCLAGSVISLGAVVGLVVALIKLRK